ncbi:hypothetical protein I5R92_08285 [Pseudomonas carnis]|uniref:hypothetical protein n=1 Tax=Pseudomonas carnis TaxID=2487355 RepID=UPI0018D5DB74|nr:hypothetical protein [Pseudomonas carnis]
MIDDVCTSKHTYHFGVLACCSAIILTFPLAAGFSQPFIEHNANALVLQSPLAKAARSSSISNYSSLA